MADESLILDIMANIHTMLENTNRMQSTLRRMSEPLDKLESFFLQMEEQIQHQTDYLEPLNHQTIDDVSTLTPLLRPSPSFDINLGEVNSSMPSIGDSNVDPLNSGSIDSGNVIVTNQSVVVESDPLSSTIVQVIPRSTRHLPPVYPLIDHAISFETFNLVKWNDQCQFDHGLGNPNSLISILDVFVEPTVPVPLANSSHHVMQVQHHLLAQQQLVRNLMDIECLRTVLDGSILDGSFGTVEAIKFTNTIEAFIEPLSEAILKSPTTSLEPPAIVDPILPRITLPIGLLWATPFVVVDYNMAKFTYALVVTGVHRTSSNIVMLEFQMGDNRLCFKGGTPPEERIRQANTIIKREEFLILNLIELENALFERAFELRAELENASSDALGHQIHTPLLKCEVAFDVFVCSEVNAMYGKCKDISTATTVFDRFEARIMVSWTALLAYSQHGFFEESLQLFFDMASEEITPNECIIFMLLTFSWPTLQLTWHSAFPPSTYRVEFPSLFLDLSTDGSPAERIVIQLFDDVVTKIADNFQGDHSGPGMPSMANYDAYSNRSQFLKIFKRQYHLDGFHFVFGMVIKGMASIKKIEPLGTPDGILSRLVNITHYDELSEEIDSSRWLHRYVAAQYFIASNDHKGGLELCSAFLQLFPIHMLILLDMASTIIYQKGSSIIRMLTEYFGNNIFQKSLCSYMKKNACKNVIIEALWSILYEESGIEVPKLLDIWPKQSEYSVLYVKLEDVMKCLTSQVYCLHENTYNAIVGLCKEDMVMKSFLLFHSLSSSHTILLLQTVAIGSILLAGIFKYMALVDLFAADFLRTKTESQLGDQMVSFTALFNVVSTKTNLDMETPSDGSAARQAFDNLFASVAVFEIDFMNPQITSFAALYGHTPPNITHYLCHSPGHIATSKEIFSRPHRLLDLHLEDKVNLKGGSNVMNIPIDYRPTYLTQPKRNDPLKSSIRKESCRRLGHRKLF